MKIKACIIGLGRIASLLEDDALREKPCTHAGAIAANDNCELAAGCDIDEERRKLFEEKWNVPVYDDASLMISTHKPQIVCIATHPDSHYHYCKIAAEYKVPVIICEKPLADSFSKARKIIKLSKNGQTKIITNHERRYSKDYIRAKEILKKGKLGKIASIRACLYMGKTRRLIDQFWHDGTHLADAIMFLTDGVLKHKKQWGAKLTAKEGTAWLEGFIKPRSTRSYTENKEFTKQNSPCNSFNSAVKKNISIPVILEIGASRDHLVFEIEFSCENGRLRIGNGIFEVWESQSSPYAENFRSLKQTDETFSGPTGYFANMLEDAVSCVLDPDRIPASGAIDGYRVIKYLNSVKKWR